MAAPAQGNQARVQLVAGLLNEFMSLFERPQWSCFKKKMRRATPRSWVTCSACTLGYVGLPAPSPARRSGSLSARRSHCMHSPGSQPSASHIFSPSQCSHWVKWYCHNGTACSCTRRRLLAVAREGRPASPQATQSMPAPANAPPKPPPKPAASTPVVLEVLDPSGPAGGAQPV